MKKENDTPKCEECGGRTALITGTFYYYPDAEPYKNGEEEDAKIESGDVGLVGISVMTVEIYRDYGTNKQY